MHQTEMFTGISLITCVCRTAASRLDYIVLYSIFRTVVWYHHPRTKFGPLRVSCQPPPGWNMTNVDSATNNALQA
ncbi:hypothetical protein BDV10DRAFT_159672 [Aspergillus recurvatus]